MLFHNMIPAQAFSQVLFRFVLVVAVLWGSGCVHVWSGVAATWRSWLPGDKR